MSAPRAIALCRYIEGVLEFQAERWSEAEAALREAVQLNRQLGAASGEALACQHLGLLLTAQGQLDEGLAILEEGLIAAEQANMRVHCLIRLYAAISRNRLLAGDMAAAGYALSLGLSMSERHGHCTTCESLLLPVAVAVLIAQKDLAAAEKYGRQLDEAAARYGSRVWLALATQTRGELAAAQGDVEAALHHFKQAQTEFELAGNSYQASQCLAASARLQEQQEP
jgi:predicted negative regulator of RcsB-dependent stress response